MPFLSIIPGKRSSDIRKEVENIPKLFMMRSRLIIVFSLLFAIAFTVVSLVSYRVSKSFILKDINLEVQEVLNAHASEVDQWLRRMIAVVSAHSHLIEIGIPDDSLITSELLAKFSRETFFSDLYFGTSSGKFISGKGWQPPVNYDPRVRPWYKSALHSKDVTVSKPYIDKETNSLAVSVSAPVFRSDGSLRGVLSADLLLSTISEKLEEVHVRGKGFAALIDSSGTSLVHQDKSLIGEDLTDNPELGDLIKQLIILKHGRVDYGLTNEKYVVFTSLPSVGWIMGIIFNKEEIYSELRLLAVKFNLIFGVSMLLVVTVSVYFSRRLTIFTEMLEAEVNERTSELKEKVAEVEYLSLTDPLTGIANRRKIESVLNEEIARSDRTTLPLSVISIDLDHFKKINDTYGHEAGDIVLKKTAEIINTGIRTTDHAGRMGGEEFIVICPDTNEAGVLLLAEKLRSAIELQEIPQAEMITSSFGCATRVAGENSDMFLARADSALYRAKERGRNRVEQDG